MTQSASIACLHLCEWWRCTGLQHPLHERPVCQCILQHLTPDMWFLFPSQRRRFNIKEGVQQSSHSELCLRLKEKRPLQDYLRQGALKCFSPIKVCIPVNTVPDILIPLQLFKKAVEGKYDHTEGCILVLLCLGSVQKGEIFRAAISEVLVASSGFLPQSTNMHRLIGGSKFTLVVNPVCAL